MGNTIETHSWGYVKNGSFKTGNIASNGNGGTSHRVSYEGENRWGTPWKTTVGHSSNNGSVKTGYIAPN